MTHICCVALDDDALRQFWEIEDHNLQRPVLSQEEKAAVERSGNSHVRDKEKRFIILLPWKANVTPLGDLRTQAPCSFKELERSLLAKCTCDDFMEVMREHFRKGHTEQTSLKEMDSPRMKVYYVPMHAVHKEDITTSKLRVVHVQSPCWALRSMTTCLLHPPFTLHSLMSFCGSDGSKSRWSLT